jgi:amino acid transporter
MASSLSVIVLRFKDPSLERPYRVAGYPVTPLIFSAVCAFLIYSALSYALSFKPISLIVLVGAVTAGVLVYVVMERR